MKQSLKQIDLIAASSDKPADALLALRHCMKSFDFGRVVLFTSANLSLPDVEVVQIPRMAHWQHYNQFILSLGKYVQNDYAMVVQDDGFIINPAKWTDAFLNYDYIGAPWPIEEHWIQNQDPNMILIMRTMLPHNRVGNGGFSLRSRRFLQYSAQFTDAMGYPEDAFLCLKNYDLAIRAGVQFPPVGLAASFSYETPLTDFGTSWMTPVALDVKQHFGFHGKNFHNSQQLIDLKNS